MSLVYWNENSGQLTPFTPSDLVGVGSATAYDALSVVSSSGGVESISTAISSPSPYYMLGYVSSGSIIQTAKIWSDGANSNIIKINDSTTTRLTISSSDIKFNGSSLIVGSSPTWSETSGVLSPTNSSDIVTIAGGIIGSSTDKLQVNGNETISSNLKVNGISTFSALTIATTLSSDGATITSNGSGSLTTSSLFTTTLEIPGTFSSASLIITGSGTVFSNSNTSFTVTNLGAMTLKTLSFGLNNVVISDNGVSASMNSIYIGQSNSINFSYLAAIGIGTSNVHVTGNYAIVVGDSSQALDDYNITIGASSVSGTGAGNISVGHSTFTGQIYSHPLSTNAIALGEGVGAQGNGNNSVAIGQQTNALGLSSVGILASVLSDNSIVIGYSGYASNNGSLISTNSTMLGASSTSYYAENAGIGYNCALTGGGNCTAIGLQAGGSGSDTTLIGHSAGANSAYTHNTAIGAGGNAGAGYNTIIGGAVQANGGDTGNIFIGYNSPGGAGADNLQITSAGFASQFTINTVHGGNGVALFYGNHVKTDGMILTTTTEPISPTAGTIIFDGTHFQGWDGSSWIQLA